MIYALFLGFPSKFVQCIIFWCSLLDRLHPDLPPPSLIFLSTTTDRSHSLFSPKTTNARSLGSLWTTHAILFFLLIGEPATAREFFFFPSEKLLGLTDRDSIETQEPTF